MINHQNFFHLLVRIGVAPFQIVAHLVRLDLSLVENPPHRVLARLRQTGVPGLNGMDRGKLRQRRNRPYFRCTAMVFRFATGQTHHPGLCLIGDLRRMRTMVRVLQSSHHSASQRLVDTLVTVEPPTPVRRMTSANDRCSTYASSIFALSASRSGAVLDLDNSSSICFSSAVNHSSPRLVFPGMLAPPPQSPCNHLIIVES